MPPSHPMRNLICNVAVKSISLSLTLKLSGKSNLKSCEVHFREAACGQIRYNIIDRRWPHLRCHRQYYWLKMELGSIIEATPKCPVTIVTQQIPNSGLRKLKSHNASANLKIWCQKRPRQFPVPRKAYWAKKLNNTPEHVLECPNTWIGELEKSAYVDTVKAPEQDKDNLILLDNSCSFKFVIDTKTEIAIISWTLAGRSS